MASVDVLDAFHASAQPAALAPRVGSTVDEQALAEKSSPWLDHGRRAAVDQSHGVPARLQPGQTRLVGLLPSTFGVVQLEPRGESGRASLDGEKSFAEALLAALSEIENLRHSR